MNSYGIKISDTEDGKGLHVELGALTPETVDPRNINPANLTPATIATLELVSMLEKYTKLEESGEDDD